MAVSNVSCSCPAEANTALELSKGFAGQQKPSEPTFSTLLPDRWRRTAGALNVNGRLLPPRQTKDTHRVLFVFLCLGALQPTANTQAVRANINGISPALPFPSPLRSVQSVCPDLLAHFSR